MWISGSKQFQAEAPTPASGPVHLVFPLPFTRNEMGSHRRAFSKEGTYSGLRYCVEDIARQGRGGWKQGGSSGSTSSRTFHITA